MMTMMLMESTLPITMMMTMMTMMMMMMELTLEANRKQWLSFRCHVSLQHSHIWVNNAPQFPYTATLLHCYDGLTMRHNYSALQLRCATMNNTALQYIWVSKATVCYTTVQCNTLGWQYATLQYSLNTFDDLPCQNQAQSCLERNCDANEEKWSGPKKLVSARSQKKEKKGD